MSKLLDSNRMCIEEYTTNEKNAEIYYKRAVGELPEMESSKALANLISPYINSGETILDVGCGCGHYFRSLKSKISCEFVYCGVDPYEILINNAKRAWKNQLNVYFQLGNIYSLPFEENSFDYIICNNVFLHLPEIKNPLEQLIKTAKNKIFIRHLLYTKSYRIQLVYNNEWWPYTEIQPEDEFDEEGNPMSYLYFNIHSFSYFTSLVKSIAPNSKITYIKDVEYDEEKINQSANNEGFIEPTRVIAGQQISGCLLQPHYFVIIDLESESKIA